MTGPKLRMVKGTFSPLKKTLKVVSAGPWQAKTERSGLTNFLSTRKASQMVCLSNGDKEKTQIGRGPGR